MRELPIFDEWLNVITDEVVTKADSLNITYSEAAGLRDDAPQEARDAYKEFLKEEAYWRNNTTAARPL